MNAFARVLSTPVTRGVAALCAAVFVAAPHAVRAGANVWTSYGPPGGDVAILAIDPITPSTLYAGTDDGVFKSTNAGATWVATGLTTTFVFAVAIDPSTPSNLYAGAGGGGVLTSTDAGATWGRQG